MRRRGNELQRDEAGKEMKRVSSLLEEPRGVLLPSTLGEHGQKRKSKRLPRLASCQTIPVKAPFQSAQASAAAAAVEELSENVKRGKQNVYRQRGGFPECVSGGHKLQAAETLEASCGVVLLYGLPLFFFFCFWWFV